MRVRFALPLVALALVARPAQAQTPQWQRYTYRVHCPVLGTCPDLVVQSTTRQGQGADFTLTIRNPFNLDYVLQPYWHLADDRIPFCQAGRDWWTTGAVETVQGTMGPGSFFPNFSCDGGSAYTPNTPIVLGTGLTTVGGCDMGPPPYDFGFYRLCPQLGFGGSVTFFLHLLDETLTLATIQDMTLYVPWYPSYANPEQGPVCTPTRPCSYEVTPEPSTILLVATGLVVLGGVTYARRRRIL